MPGLAMVAGTERAEAGVVYEMAFTTSAVKLSRFRAEIEGTWPNGPTGFCDDVQGLFRYFSTTYNVCSVLPHWPIGSTCSAQPGSEADEKVSPERVYPGALGM